jgi:signal transduction histidine kinase
VPANEIEPDLKNPLQAISLTTLALRRSAPGAAAAGQAERIDRAVARMTRLIDDLLAAAKIESGELRPDRRPEDAAGLMKSAVEMFRPIAEAKSIDLSSRPPPSGALVSCERHLILRVLANLIGNAIKFSPRGGAIEVTADCGPDWVRIAVRDEGPGIAAEHRAHVFDRYWQQKGGDRRGSGLGLYIAKGIAEAHGGRIWIDGGAGSGTTVSFTLPLDQVAPGAARASTKSKCPSA